MKKLLLLSLVLLLSACGSKLDGTYTSDDENGKASLTFKSNGKVSRVSSLVGKEIETSYEIDGDKIKFQFDGGFPIVLTLQKNGTLEGWPFGKLKKN